MLAPIHRKDVDAALARIDKDGVPKRRGSTGYCLVANGRHYPPKLAIGYASEHRTGKRLPPSAYSGGEETNSRLRALGFMVEECDCGGDSGVGGSDEDPAIARIVIASHPITEVLGDAAGIRTAREILKRSFQNWPTAVKTRYLITPGGFLTLAKYPDSASDEAGWTSTKKNFQFAAKRADEILERVLTPDLRRAASSHVEVLTLGIDLDSDPYSAQLVAFVDLARPDQIRWTGKSYPTQGYEEHKLQLAVDLKTHCVRFKDDRVLVLGCHDLNMFSKRVEANVGRGSRRAMRVADMNKVASAFRPTVVLHHPHRTDSARIWQTAWGGIAELGQSKWKNSLRCFASGIGYYPDGKPVRQTLSKVRAGTCSKGDRTLDFIFKVTESGVVGPKVRYSDES